MIFNNYHYYIIVLVYQGRVRTKSIVNIYLCLTDKKKPDFCAQIGADDPCTCVRHIHA